LRPIALETAWFHPLNLKCDILVSRNMLPNAACTATAWPLLLASTDELLPAFLTLLRPVKPTPMKEVTPAGTGAGDEEGKQTSQSSSTTTGDGEGDASRATSPAAPAAATAAPIPAAPAAPTAPSDDAASSATSEMVSELGRNALIVVGPLYSR
jgi:hypothetical protein